MMAIAPTSVSDCCKNVLTLPVSTVRTTVTSDEMRLINSPTRRSA